MPSPVKITKAIRERIRKIISDKKIFDPETIRISREGEVFARNFADKKLQRVGWMSTLASASGTAFENRQVPPLQPN